MYKEQSWEILLRMQTEKFMDEEVEVKEALLLEVWQIARHGQMVR